MKLLNLKIISNRELSTLAKTIYEDLQNKEATLVTLNCIDDLLNIKKMESFLHIGIYTRAGFLRKNVKKHTDTFIKDRIDLFINELNKI